VQDHIATSGEVNTNTNNAPATTAPEVPESEERQLRWNDLELASLGQDVDWENLTLCGIVCRPQPSGAARNGSRQYTSSIDVEHTQPSIAGSKARA
jgi:hypothetical protein